MGNTTTSPAMGMPIPNVAVDPSPDWANNINASLLIVDGHNHSPGQGDQITPNGLNINSDLTMNSNNLISTRSVRFTAESNPLSGASDVGCIYESGVDLYYNDGNGNQVRITQAGSVTGAAGTITGLPSGTASAAYSGGTFTFQSATSTPANLVVGPITIGRNVASSKTITISPSSGQAANYSLFLPAAAPAANQVLVSDGSGNFTWTLGLIQIGMVIGTFPNLTGAYSCTTTTAGDAYGFVKCNGGTISDSSSPMNGQVVPNINNSVFLEGSTSAGSTGGSNNTTLTTTQLPAHTHGAGSYATSVGVTGGTASLSSNTVAGTSHTHNFAHYHQWGYAAGFSNGWDLYALESGSASTTGFTTGAGTTEIYSSDSVAGATGSIVIPAENGAITSGFYTTGALGAPSGSGSSAVTGTESTDTTVGISSTAASMTGSNSVTGTSTSTGSGSAYDSRPAFITTLYVMRIK